MTQADRQPLDARLFDGFERELQGVLGGEPQWYRLMSDGEPGLALQLGAICSVYVVGVDDCAYLMHCSWDS